MPRKEKIKDADIDTMRHSAAHVLAAAVLELYPKTKFGIGPVIENGFYYDFDIYDKRGKPAQLTPDDLPKIERKMERIIARNEKFVKAEFPLNKAINFFKKQKQDYKVELLEDIKKYGTTEHEEIVEAKKEKMPLRPRSVMIYSLGKFVDLCRGPHVQSAKNIGVFKLTRVAGAYWRGDESKKMLQRIYGLAFAVQKELDKHLVIMEELKTRDHRKLGVELELFLNSPETGLGLPIWLPKGALVRELLVAFLKEEQARRGYKAVVTPHIGRLELFRASGHWQTYRESMYAPIKIDQEKYLLKPMNCPFHIQVYTSALRSYRDLPLRLAEFGAVYRYEKTGELSGLTRVRGFTQDDAHLFVRPDQVRTEILDVIDLILYVFRVLKFKDYKARLGLRDPRQSRKYVGNERLWRHAEHDIEEAVREKGMAYSREEGEAAFYGPKLDFVVRDVLGREWQLGTVQVDYNLPARFNLEYVGEDGEKHRPVMIHRAPFGSLERFFAILIEHFGGAFPLWLSPVQAQIIPVGSRHTKPALQLAENLQKAGIRVEIDTLRETVGYKIRKTEKKKVPYILVVGDIEARGKTVNVRQRGVEKVKRMRVRKLIEKVKKEIEKKE